MKAPAGPCANRRRDTGPELAIRRILHAHGLRYRVDVRPLADLNRRADIVYPRARVAVFIDGCFWHGCPEHYTPPKTNGDFWVTKVMTNRDRDREADELLAAAGWTVVRIWEHVPAQQAAGLIRDRVSGTGHGGTTRDWR